MNVRSVQGFMSVNPVVKARPRRGAHGNWYTPRETQDYEQALGWRFISARTKAMAGSREPYPFMGPVVVFLHFRYQTVRSKPDLDNFAKAVLDAGNKQLWKDDSQVVELHLSMERVNVRPGFYYRIEDAPTSTVSTGAPTWYVEAAAQ